MTVNANHIGLWTVLSIFCRFNLPTFSRVASSSSTSSLPAIFDALKVARKTDRKGNILLTMLSIVFQRHSVVVGKPACKALRGVSKGVPFTQRSMKVVRWWQ